MLRTFEVTAAPEPRIRVWAERHALSLQDPCGERIPAALSLRKWTPDHSDRRGTAQNVTVTLKSVLSTRPPDSRRRPTIREQCAASPRPAVDARVQGPARLTRNRIAQEWTGAGEPSCTGRAPGTSGRQRERSHHAGHGASSWMPSAGAGSRCFFMRRRRFRPLHVRSSFTRQRLPTSACMRT
jgi:hypothetical protein